MKKFLLLSILLTGFIVADCQSKTNYAGDVDKVFGLIRNGAYKNGYDHLISFANVNAAAINVNPNTSYLIFFVYDNSSHPAAHFKAALMTPDSVLREKYTSRPFDRGQVGVARAQQLQIRTPNFSVSKSKTRPVKFDATPKSMIYVFFKK